MKRSLVAALLCLPLTLAACGEDRPDTTGDSVTENTQTDSPGSPSPSE